LKKVISIVIIFTFLLPLTLPTVSAKNTLTKTEAIKIFERGYGRTDLVVYGDANDLPWLTEKERDRYLIYDRMRIDYDSEEVAFEESTSGEKYETAIKYQKHNVVTDFDESTWRGEETTVTVDFLNSYILEYYTEDMKERLLTSEYRYRDPLTGEWIEKRCELFRTDEVTGTALVCRGVQYDRQFDLFELGNFLNVYDFKASSSEAVLTIVAISRDYISGHSPTVETVEFTNTRDGWRISGGTLFEVAYFNAEPSYGYEVSEFEKLALNSYNEYSLLRGYTPEYCLRRLVSQSGKEYWYFDHLMYSEKPMFEITDPYVTVTFTHSLNGEKYDTPQVYYRASVGAGYLSLNTTKEYRDYLASIMLPSLYEPLLCSEDGKLEYFRDETSNGGILISKELYDIMGERHMEYYYSGYNGYRMLSRNRARIEILFGRYDMKTESKKYAVTYVDAILKDGRWLAYGGELFDIIEGKASFRKYAPVITGDDSAGDIIFLSLVSVFSLAGVVKIYTRAKMR